MSNINNIFLFDFAQVCQVKSGCFNKLYDYWCCNIRDFNASNFRVTVSLDKGSH